MRTAAYLLVALLVLAATAYLIVVTGAADDTIPSPPPAEGGPPPASSAGPGEPLPPAEEASSPDPASVERDDVAAPSEDENPLSTRPEGPAAAPGGNDPGARLAGAVKDRLTGRPIAGAKVVILARRGAPLRRANTGSDGRYTLSGVLPAHRALVASAEGYASTRRRIRMDSSSRADVHFDFQLKPKTRVAGRVTGPDGLPLAGAGVNTFPMRRAVRAARSPKPRAVSDADGRFVVWLTGGSTERKRKMRLFASKHGYAPGQSRAFEIWPGARVDQLAIGVDWAGRVEGRVFRDDRTPFKGVDLSLLPMTRGKLGVTASDGPVVHLRGRTDEHGKFRLEDVPAGTYRLTAWFGRLRLTRDGILVTGRGTTGGLTLELATGRAVVGTVLGEGARPLKGARVCIEPAAVPLPPPGATRRVRPKGQQWATTDREGRYQFFRLTDAAHRVVVKRRGYTSATVPSVVPGGPPLRTTLKRILAVRGVVIMPDGKPCPAFSVRAFMTYQKRAWPGSQRPVRDVKGCFSLPPELFTGPPPYSIRISTESGFISDRVGVILASGPEPEPLRIQLRPGGAVSGVVRGGDGHPVAGAAVSIRSDDNRLRRTVRTTVRGRFEMNALPPGDYTVTTTHPDWVGASESVSIAGAGRRRLICTMLREGATLRLSVVDEHGAPVRRAYLILQAERGGHVAANVSKYRKLFYEAQRTQPDLDWAAYFAAVSRTDASGRLERRFLPGGRYRVHVRASGYLPATTRVAVAPGSGAAVRLALERRPRPPKKGPSPARKPVAPPRR